MKKIAVITPINKSDYLANTVLDGLIELTSVGELEFRMTGNYPTPFEVNSYVLSDEDFIEYAKSADLIILAWGKKSTNYALAEKIGMWNKTVFVDGSELGKDNRFNIDIQDQVMKGTYDGIGAIDQTMLEKCRRYFRREKPYRNGILSFPFGIERRYGEHYSPEIKKDIDFVCIFGQENYPKMRKEARLLLEKFCKKNNFTCATSKTKGFDFDDSTKIAGRSEFYSLLARGKVGISIGGGGFDTARFWEILGNNCMLLTERIDIDIPQSLAYSRIYEFSAIEEFEKKLIGLGEYIRMTYNQNDMIYEYRDILSKHSSRARVEYILQKSL